MSVDQVARWGIRRGLDWLTEKIKAHYELERWKSQYELDALRSGVYVQAPKPNSSAWAQPPHWLCNACFENHVRSHLQSQGYLDEEVGELRWQCHNDSNHFITMDFGPDEHRSRGVESGTPHRLPSPPGVDVLIGSPVLPRRRWVGGESERSVPPETSD